MIYLGLADSEKEGVVRRYAQAHEVRKIVLIHGKSAPYLLDADRVTYEQAILYVYFYRLLQEIDEHTLVVVDECLRTQNRYDLTYNCIRHYLNRTPHVIVFQLLPQIDEPDDFMILFDFVTQSQWKRRKFDADLIAEYAHIEAVPFNFSFTPIAIHTAVETQQKYVRERHKLFDILGSRDPHIIPRNLYLIGGTDKRAYIDAQAMPLFGDDTQFVARNRRLGRDNVITYGEAQPGQRYTIVEFPHRFNDFSDFVYVIPLWLQMEFNLTNATSLTETQFIPWEAGKHKMWMRPKKAYSIKFPMWDTATQLVADKNKGFGFYDVFRNFERCYHDTAFLVGLRGVESPNRWRTVSKNPVEIGGQPIYWGTPQDDNVRLYPLYDWNFHRWIAGLIRARTGSNTTWRTYDHRNR